MNKPVRTSKPWNLQDAKARFSELVRLANEVGPQRVAVHGKEKAVVISCEDYARMSASSQSAGATGVRLVEIMQDARIKGLKFGRESVRAPVRDAPDFNLDNDHVSAGHKRRKRTSKIAAE